MASLEQEAKAEMWKALTALLEELTALAQATRAAVDNHPRRQERGER